MANPFEDKQDTTGGKAGFGAFNELTSDKAYDDETLTDNPGAPLPTPVANPPETFIKGRQVTRPDYEGIQLKKFRDLKKTCEAMDDIFEKEYIDKINSKKGEIKAIMQEAFGAIPANPTATQQLITTPASAPDTGVVYQSGIGTFSYAEDDTVDPPTSLIGVKGQIFPDILAAFHYPALSNPSHGETDLPLSNGVYIRVSRNITTGSGEYSTNNLGNLGIGRTVYHSGDAVDDRPDSPLISPAYAGAVGVVTSQSPIGNFYFFSDIDAVRTGSATSITNLITDINDLRVSLRVRIGIPQEVSDAGINTLRETKTQDELNVWYDEAGNRTSNIQDYQGGINALTGLATSISEYNG